MYRTIENIPHYDAFFSSTA